MFSRVSASVITIGVYQVNKMWLALLVYNRWQGVVSRVSTSVITVGVYQVARCG